MSSGQLQIQMLGQFALSYGENSINDKNDRSRKLWTLLEYLITFRDREVSQNELIELLWPEDENDNPVSSLKTLLHRVRHLLDELNYRSGKELIITRRGAYSWNTALPYTVDVDQFEALCKQGEASDDPEETLSCYLDAIALYKGDFLPKSGLDAWAVPVSIYYRALYLRVVHDAIALLVEQAQHETIVRVCHAAILIDPYDEDLHYHLIQALVNMGNYQSAAAQYDHVTNLFFTEFGVTPSDKLTALYRQVVKREQNLEIDLGSIKQDLQEKNIVRGAFFCEYEFFKDIYRLEARASARVGQSIFVALITLADSKGETPPRKVLNTAMEKLRLAIGASLRMGDVFSRYSVSQYIVMLPTLTVENCERVLRRIISKYQRDNPRSTVTLTYKIQPIDPIM